MNTDTKAFITLQLIKNQELHSGDLAQLVHDTYGLTVSPEKVKGEPRWKVGDKFLIPEGLGSHNNDDTRSMYERFEGKTGVVLQTHRENPNLSIWYPSKYESIKARIDGETVILAEAQKGSYIGICKTAPIPVPGPLLEIIYIRDKRNKVTMNQIKTARAYVDRGLDKGEKRSYRYYTGPVLGMRKSNGGVRLWFMCQQRDYEIRSINPASGQLLYIGLQGQRPKGWKEEYLRLSGEEGVEIEESYKELDIR